ncbi:Gastrulation defective protein 1-like protein [Armadillidium nasatum]|uniref:Gastrulation defective protein 1-like protein n=1 Tax=Armadillidium nasatum TaxID=96803 RepID=A0A5N5SJP8_9CRUS|nr:Gastrulation defective protein 1-like protein [Armadillidium nasatum]
MFGKGKISFGKISLKTKQDENGKKSEDEVTLVSNSGFGKFGNEKSTSEDRPDRDLNQSMGFGTFGKSAKKFDLSEMVEESRRIAAERNKDKIDNDDEKIEEEKKETPSTSVIKTNTVMGEKSDNVSSDEDDDEEVFGPPLPPEMIKSNDKARNSEESDDDEEEENNVKFPINYELDLCHGTKAVSALTVDPAGSRLVSGSIDYDVRYWDFQGMDLAKEAFRSFRPSDGYPINSVEYSCTGDKVLVVSGSAQAKIYDRDGVEVYECVRGDMYLHDMAKTKGHIASLSDGKWHPKNKEEFLTSARDGTCRIWNTTKTLQQVSVLKPRSTNGLKTHPATCNYSRDGFLLACACDDGSIQMWDHRKNFVNTTINIRNGHDRGDLNFVTRGEDTLKLWDIRNYKAPVHAHSNLFSKFSGTDCLFSPNDRLVVTGTSMEKNSKGGTLKFYDRNSFDLVKEIELENSHVVRVIWHPKLNQIMLGCGDGQIRIFYDPKESRNGAILVAGKRKKRVKQAEIIVSQQIITPHALPLFREERHKSNRKMEEKDRKDPVRSQQPELPLGKTGSGGRVSTGGSTLSSYIIRNMGIRNKVREEGDPREALLKHAKEAATNPYWVTPAYSKTQPQTLFHQDDEEEPVTKKQKKEQ